MNNKGVKSRSKKKVEGETDNEEWDSGVGVGGGGVEAQDVALVGRGQSLLDARAGGHLWPCRQDPAHPPGSSHH